jgi:tRNA 2-thiouridine synthesizing protein A
MKLSPNLSRANRIVVFNTVLQSISALTGKKDQANMSNSVHATKHYIDVRRDVCPMTFVRVRLMLDKMPKGECLEVLFNGEEAARNLPRSATEQGHVVVSQSEGKLILRKGGVS